MLQLVKKGQHRTQQELLLTTNANDSKSNTGVLVKPEFIIASILSAFVKSDQRRMYYQSEKQKKQATESVQSGLR